VTKEVQLSLHKMTGKPVMLFGYDEEQGQERLEGDQMRSFMTIAGYMLRGNMRNKTTRGQFGVADVVRGYKEVQKAVDSPHANYEG
jgi:hypothetical protein